MQMYTSNTGVFTGNVSERDSINVIEQFNYDYPSELEIAVTTPPVSAVWVMLENGYFWNISKAAASTVPPANMPLVNPIYTRVRAGSIYADGILYPMPYTTFTPAGTTTTAYSMCTAFMQIHDFGDRLRANLIGGTDSEDRAFLVDGSARIVSYSHGLSFERLAAPSGGGALPANCLRYGTRMACLFSIADHGPYQLLREIAPVFPLAEVRPPGEIRMARLDDAGADGRDYEVSTVTIASEYKLQLFKIYLFVALETFMRDVNVARNTAIGVSVAIAVVMTGVSFFLLGAITGQLEDLSMRLLEDPFRDPRDVKEKPRRDAGDADDAGGADAESSASCVDELRRCVQRFYDCLPLLSEIAALELEFAAFRHRIDNLRGFMRHRGGAAEAGAATLASSSPSSSLQLSMGCDELNSSGSSGGGRSSNSASTDKLCRTIHRSAAPKQSEVPDASTVPPGGSSSELGGSGASLGSVHDEDQQPQLSPSGSGVQPAKRHVKFADSVVEPHHGQEMKKSSSKKRSIFAGGAAAADAAAVSAAASGAARTTLADHLQVYCFACVEFGACRDLFRAELDPTQRAVLHGSRQQHRQQQQQQQKGADRGGDTPTNAAALLSMTTATAQAIDFMLRMSGATLLEFFGDSCMLCFRIKGEHHRSRLLLRFMLTIFKLAETGNVGEIDRMEEERRKKNQQQEEDEHRQQHRSPRASPGAPAAASLHDAGDAADDSDGADVSDSVMARRMRVQEVAISCRVGIACATDRPLEFASSSAPSASASASPLFSSPLSAFAVGTAREASIQRSLTFLSSGFSDAWRIVRDIETRYLPESEVAVAASMGRGNSTSPASDERKPSPSQLPSPSKPTLREPHSILDLPFIALSRRSEPIAKDKRLFQLISIGHSKLKRFAARRSFTSHASGVCDRDCKFLWDFDPVGRVSVLPEQWSAGAVQNSKSDDDEQQQQQQLDQVLSRDLADSVRMADDGANKRRSQRPAPDRRNFVAHHTGVVDLPPVREACCRVLPSWVPTMTPSSSSVPGKKSGSQEG